MAIVLYSSFINTITTTIIVITITIIITIIEIFENIATKEMF